MKRYIIKVNGLYFCGEDEAFNTQILPTAGFHSSNKGMSGIVLTGIKENAKIISGKTNLRSWINRIMDKLDVVELIITETGATCRN